MLNPVQVKLDAVTASLALFVENKKASTAALSHYVSLFNARAPRAELVIAMNRYIGVFNSMTDHSNALRTAMDAVVQAAADQTVSLENLTEEQVEEMKNNPQQYFAAGYLTLLNSLLFFPRDVGLSLIDSVRADMVQDLNDTWNDSETGITPDPPRISVFFQSDHVLDMVKKHLEDVIMPSPEDDEYFAS